MSDDSVTRADLDALRELLNERDRLYTERDTSRRTAIEAALAAAQTLNAATFAASEKAIQKAETNSDRWRENANEWRAAMMDREQRFATKGEVSAELSGIKSEMATLKDARAQSAGGKQVKDEGRANIAIAVSVISFLVMLATVLLKVVGK